MEKITNYCVINFISTAVVSLRKEKNIKAVRNKMFYIEMKILIQETQNTGTFFMLLVLCWNENGKQKGMNVSYEN